MTISTLNFHWSEERIAKAKALWAEGASASQIARGLAEFGVCPSRCAVIGKMHRLGLSGQRTKKTERRQTYPQERSLKVQRPVEAPPPPAFEEPHVGELVTLLNLEYHHCRWPVGDPQHAEFGFCGRRKRTGSPYCPDHSRIAFVPKMRRGRDADAETEAASDDVAQRETVAA